MFSCFCTKWKLFGCSANRRNFFPFELPYCVSIKFQILCSSILTEQSLFSLFSLNSPVLTYTDFIFTWYQVLNTQLSRIWKISTMKWSTLLRISKSQSRKYSRCEVIKGVGALWPLSPTHPNHPDPLFSNLPTRKTCALWRAMEQSFRPFDVPLRRFSSRSYP